MPLITAERRRTLRADVTASLVVFLVALPLCVGVAVASGVPAELGLITGIVGGLVTGLLPGSSLQVSGPAAGLTVLVFTAVSDYGLPALGVIVLGAGLIQVALGALRLGRWFRAISLAVVQGMLAGIGLVLIAGQLYALADAKAPGGGLADLAGLPRLVLATLTSQQALLALAVGVGTARLIAVWPRVSGRAGVVPGALVAVGAATALTALLDLPISRVEVRGLLHAIQPPGLSDAARLADVGLAATVVAFALIASAESLFSANAVDRLHSGRRTDYDKELVAQGAGNTVCGLLGSLPMTAVIVRSSANVRAGARTKLSRVLHGVWLLIFVALLPQALSYVPTAALAGVLIHAGWKLIPVREIRPLWRDHRGEAVVLLVTAAAIVTTNMFEGVLIGLLLAVVKTAWAMSHVHISVSDTGAGAGGGSGGVRVRLTGNATFLRLPRILDTLEALPQRHVELDLSGVRHLDHACMTALQGWADERNAHISQPAAGAGALGGPETAGAAGGTPGHPDTAGAAGSIPGHPDTAGVRNAHISQPAAGAGALGGPETAEAAGSIPGHPDTARVRNAHISQPAAEAGALGGPETAGTAGSAGGPAHSPAAPHPKGPPA
ncbi:transmembrane sulfate transport protein [Streptomyces spongiicola]|uniref:Transmembrane sulfate transport protein n=1 Tax=Streptomyces spongiicola TaxID=1690221 RepID=A0A388SQY6_9ACTN|nr:SulP family inorganic anion transporter [Streptomyces spongiicola]GBP98978.1 transmembrane sulfate transport protein [Streptomyces spongiicola]